MEFEFLTPNAGQPAVKRAGLRPRARPVIMDFCNSASDTRQTLRSMPDHLSLASQAHHNAGDLLCRGRGQPLQVLCRQMGKQVGLSRERMVEPLSQCCDRTSQVT